MKMENRLTKLFKEKKDKILSIYFTAGYPNLSSTLDIVKYLTDAKVDFIEIGIPFSDSLVDGPTIQESNEIALRNGMNLKQLFKDLERLREISEIPVILMGCINPILMFGMDKFVSELVRLDIDGALIADLPPEEFDSNYSKLFSQSNLSFIPLVTKHCNAKRIKYLDSLSDGFLYVVSSDAITGTEVNNQSMASIKELGCKNPSIIGFGITNSTKYDEACRLSNGAIIGSAFIKAITGKKDDELKNAIFDFVKKIR